MAVYIKGGERVMDMPDQLTKIVESALWHCDMCKDWEKYHVWRE